MGEFSRQLAERFSSRGAKIGYCAICRAHGNLTKDHVPPKGCGNIKDNVIRDIYGNGTGHKGQYAISQGGLHFKTICGNCNSTLLGTEYDPALSVVVGKIEDCLRSAHQTPMSLPRKRQFEYQPNRFIRAVLGHLLAANSGKDVLNIKPAPPLDDAIRAYVLNPTATLHSNIRIYYWLYPYHRKVIMKHCAMGLIGSDGTVIYGHLLKFFPFGFWIVWDEKVDSLDRIIHLPRLDLDASPALFSTAHLSIEFYPLQHPFFPETPTNDRLWLLVDHLTSQAEPKE